MVSLSKTLCPYCGVGCGLEVLPPAQPGKPVARDSEGNPVWQARGDRDHPSSKGMVCVKGATIGESLSKSRLKHPMLRDSLDEPFRRVSWDEALDRVAERIQAAHSTFGPDAICMYGSGQLQTEDYYIAQKLLKGCLGTNNFDANSRLCMSSAVAGYIQSFGSDGPPCCYDDLERTDCAFLIGTNTAECHPIVFNRLRKHHKRTRKVKLIVVDPRRTPTAEAADLHLAIEPGTDIDLLNGIAHLLLRWGFIDPVFVDECTRGFEKFAEVISHYPPERVARTCGLRIDDVVQAARYWARAERVLSLWSMGMNQSSEGTAKVRTLINLHLMTGDIGKPGAGPFSLTGQPNAMGGREAGGLAHILPGYRLVKNPQHRAEVERGWGLPPGSISPIPGRPAWDMITGLETGEVQVFWVAATNPAVSMPDIERTKSALRRSPFTVYQDAYYPTETADYAHVLLPAAQWSEKTGAMTNSERVVTLCPTFRQPPGEARPDWEIMVEVGRRLGFTEQFDLANSAAVYAEFVALTRDRLCDCTGLSHARLAAEGPIQWPCPKGMTAAENQQSKRLYEDLRFKTGDGRAQFAAFHSRGLAEPTDSGYPLVLTTGRLYGHWHTQTRTGRIDKILKLHPEPELEIHPRDAADWGIEDKTWVEAQSRRGAARFRAKVTRAIAPGTVFVPMHWGALWAEQSEANALTHPESCPASLQPELKACAVCVVPAGAEPSAQQSAAGKRPAVLAASGQDAGSL
ncbi:Anaerobic dehydrogenase, typically selenocysteine-containing [Rubidibacter lacunae KORDI 51-2]|uniref:Anaerobic dehydrogenase, typically selenocysteine-containing n=1 Tax=Rubidibacter lacunae KORDI 51-2 TaxID=582515 RepID=U5DHP9_9CHRO|nr:nitrate reductase [Rubidibacter lacunae]ERN40124.1 Anaerobic dehydrogenase, typically selenocysteine-containing [Rubidibacter lacunae KORDI 51-2]